MLKGIAWKHFDSALTLNQFKEKTESGKVNFIGIVKKDQTRHWSNFQTMFVFCDPPLCFCENPSWIWPLSFFPSCETGLCGDFMTIFHSFQQRSVFPLGSAADQFVIIHIMLNLLRVITFVTGELLSFLCRFLLLSSRLLASEGSIVITSSRCPGLCTLHWPSLSPVPIQDFSRKDSDPELCGVFDQKDTGKALLFAFLMILVGILAQDLFSFSFLFHQKGNSSPKKSRIFALLLVIAEKLVASFCVWACCVDGFQQLRNSGSFSLVSDPAGEDRPNGNQQNSNTILFPFSACTAPWC